MKILMASSNHWTSVFQVGSHHLAREFLKMGHQVAFISDPISLFHIKSHTFKERYSLYSSGGLKEGNLWAYVPWTLLPPTNKPLLRSNWVHRHWQNLTFPSLTQKAKQNGFGEVDLLYFDTPVQSFWLKEIRARKSVYRMADKNSGFKRSTPALMALEKELIKNVDHVVCTAKTLVDFVGEKAYHLPNGVPLAHFTKPTSPPPEYAHIPKPIAVYVGAMEYWFHFNLMEKLAKEMPDVSFVLIGPLKEKRMPPLKNIHILGPRSYEQIPSYLQFADVGLIPFHVENYPDLIHSVNPLKLYEYMASGLPVVATRWKELENIQSPAYLCETAQEFKDGIKAALKADGLVERAFAKNLDWSSRAEKLLDWIAINS